MKLQHCQVLCLAVLVGLLVKGPPASGPAVVVPQPISVVMIEDSLRGTTASDAVQRAVQQYCQTSQQGRYRRFDYETSRDPSGNIPAGYEAYFSDYAANGRGAIRWWIVAKEGKRVLLTGPLPPVLDDALVELRKYGG